MSSARPSAARAARLMIRWHGDKAALRAAQRVDRFFAQGELDGAASWQGILATIQELQLRRGGRRGPG